MMTEKEVKKYLAEMKKELKHYEREFEKYDNHDDMEAISQCRASVSSIEKILNGKPNAGE